MIDVRSHGEINEKLGTITATCRNMKFTLKHGKTHGIRNETAEKTNKNTN